MSIGAEVARQTLDRILNGSWISLHVGDTQRTGANEVHGGQYKRQQPAWGKATDAGKAISSQLIFMGMPLVDVANAGAWDAETGGNFLWTFRYGAVIKPPSGAAYVFVIDAGDLTARLTDSQNG